MTRTIERIEPLSAGKIFGAMYFALSLIFVPLFAIPMFLMGQTGDSPFGWAFMVGAPILYGVMGFVGSAFFAWIYNLFASWLGGLEVVVSQATDVSTFGEGPT